MSIPVIEAPRRRPSVTWQEGELLARRGFRAEQAQGLALLVAGWAVHAQRLAGGRVLPPVRHACPNPLEVGAEMWEIVASGALVSDFFASVLKTFAGFLVAV